MDAANIFVLFLTIGFFALIGYLAIISRRPQRTNVEPQKQKDEVRRAA